jgi:3-hydroxy-3-methylglutaryl CoA synthase
MIVSGIIGYGSYLPYYRLTRQAMGGGRGERTIASYDEDSVSMAVEAGRQALAGADASAIDNLIFATTSPPYAEKLNAAALSVALDLQSSTRSVEVGCNSRMGLAALLLGADMAAAGRTSLVCAADVVVGAPGGARERDSGDAAVAFVTGPAEQAIARAHCEAFAEHPPASSLIGVNALFEPDLLVEIEADAIIDASA